MSSIMTKYALKNLSDYVTFNLKAQMVIYGYPNGTLTKPLLMYGAPGSGKTELAKLLAANIIPDMTPYDIEFVDVSKDTSINTVRRLDMLMHTYAVNSRNLRVVILDEVDNFSRPAMDALKGLITKFPSLDRGVWFIMTTNHLGSISTPVRDRCTELYMPPTTVADVLPMAKRVLDGEGVPYDDAVLRAALTKDSSGLSSFRDMWSEVEEILTRRAMSALKNP